MHWFVVYIANVGNVVYKAQCESAGFRCQCTVLELVDIHSHHDEISTDIHEFEHFISQVGH